MPLLDKTGEDEPIDEDETNITSAMSIKYFASMSSQYVHLTVCINAYMEFQ